MVGFGRRMNRDKREFKKAGFTMGAIVHCNEGEI